MSSHFLIVLGFQNEMSFSFRFLLEIDLRESEGWRFVATLILNLTNKFIDLVLMLDWRTPAMAIRQLLALTCASKLNFVMFYKVQNPVLWVRSQATNGELT